MEYLNCLKLRLAVPLLSNLSVALFPFAQNVYESFQVVLVQKDEIVVCYLMTMCRLQSVLNIR
jgi:hypothetical protein